MLYIPENMPGGIDTILCNIDLTLRVVRPFLSRRTLGTHRLGLLFLLRTSSRVQVGAFYIEPTGVH